MDYDARDDKSQMHHTITLISADGVAFPMRTAQMALSGVVSAALDRDPGITELKIDVDSQKFKVIRAYLVHHDGIAGALARPVRSSDMRKNCADPWDAGFIDKLVTNRQFFYGVITKAHEMQIEGLSHLGAAKIAAMVRGQPPYRIRQICNVDQTENIAALKREAEEAAEHARLAGSNDGSRQ
jgi:hypothetical protein